MSRSVLAEKHPWTLPWWKTDGENFWVLLYLVAIPLSFVQTGISCAIYLIVAIIWLIPDRRIEKTLAK